MDENGSPTHPTHPSQAGDAYAPHGGTTDRGDLALVLTGGGARGAYQVGFLRYLAKTYPQLRIPVLVGVSAGAINAALLAQHHGTLRQATDELAGLWSELLPERIFRIDVRALLGKLGRWGLGWGAGEAAPEDGGLVDTGPLRDFLEEALSPVDGVLTGIDYNLHRGTLRALAIPTTNYNTGQSVVWVQGREIETWERPKRTAVHTRLTVDHVMASAALPMVFPAVCIEPHWYGDGGIGLSAPLSPALHLGAHKILVVSNRYDPSPAEAARPKVASYPPPAQIISLLLDAIFLEVVDQDVARLERINGILRGLPEERRDGMRVVDVLVMRPSQDLGRIAVEYEPRLPRAMRVLTRGSGARETSGSGALSMLMFQDDYVKRLIALGEADAGRRGAEIDRFVNGYGEVQGEAVAAPTG